MTVVLDASAAVSMSVGTAGAKRLRRQMKGKFNAIAPELFVAEVANSLGKYVRVRQMPVAEAEENLLDALSLIGEMIPMADLAVESFGVARAEGHPAYDAFYLVLARRRGATLITVDARLATWARKMGIQVSAP